MRENITRRNFIGVGALGALALSLDPLVLARDAQDNPANVGPIIVGIEPITLDSAAQTTLFPTGTSVLDKLPNETTLVTSFQQEANGSISYLVANVAAKGQIVVVKQDYMKWVPYKKPGENIDYRVGVGIRTVAKVKVLKGSINTGGLLPLGIEANLQRISGTLEMSVLGISGANITAAIPLPSALTPETVQKAIEASAIIKSRIFDTPTGQNPGTAQPVTITPQYIAKQVTGTPIKNGKMVLIAGEAALKPNLFLNAREIQ